MKINHSVQPPPTQSASRQIDTLTTATAQLTELKNQLGEIVHAKILAIELSSATLTDKSPKAQDNSSVPSDKPSKPLLTDTPPGGQDRAVVASRSNRVADVYQRALLDSKTLDSKTLFTDKAGPDARNNSALQSPANLRTPVLPPQSWQIILQIAGLNKLLTTEFQALNLPANWIPGQSLLLKIDPTTGLKILTEQASQQDQLSRSLLQSLARFLPVQGNLRNQLSTLIAVARQQDGSFPAQHTQAQTSSDPATTKALSPPWVAPATVIKGKSVQAAPNPPSATGQVGTNGTSIANTDQIRQTLVTLLQQTSTSKLSTTPAQTAGLASSQVNQAIKSNEQPANISTSGQQLKQPTIPPLTNQLLTLLSKAMLTPVQSQDPVQLKAGLRQTGMAMEAALLSAKQISGAENPSTRENSQQLSRDIREWLEATQSNTNRNDPLAILRSPLLQAAPADLKALLLTTLTATISHLQQTSANHQLPTNWESLVSWLMPRTTNFHPAEHPLEFPSQVAQVSRQAATIDGLNAGEILRALAQTIARIHVNQLNALQQNLGQPGEPSPNQVWFAELPILGQQLDTLQLRLEKDSQRKEKSSQKHQWKLILAFDFEGLGPLQSHVLYTNGTVSATFWADQQQTLRMVNDELPKLRKGLQDWGITVGDIAVRKGQPPSPKNPISHQLLDERV